MIDALPLLLGSDEYQISRSVRLRSSATAYLSRSAYPVASAGTQWTMSMWVKRGALGTSDLFSFVSTTGSALQAGIAFNSDNAIRWWQYAPSTYQFHKVTTAVFRDTSAWYHLVFVYDTTLATAADRCQIWVNGVRQTSFSTNIDPSLNLVTYYKTGTLYPYIGAENRNASSALTPLDGYLTEINFIDGLNPNTTTRTVGGVTQTVLSELGQFDSITGVWKPAPWTRSFGTNGFYLNFSDPSAATAAAIGKDYSGNSNNWTPNNISVTAGATYDSMLDVPTPWADGGNGRGNYAVLNPLDSFASGVSNGNLTFSNGAGLGYKGISTFVIDDIAAAQKYYVEYQSDAGYLSGIVTTANSGAASNTSYSDIRGYYNNGNKYSGTTATAYGATFTSSDQLAMLIGNGQIEFFKNNVSQGVAFTGLTGAWKVCTVALGAAGVGVSYNFGQRPFAYTPPSGFKALNTQNLPDATIPNGRRNFDIDTYTGNATARSRTGFQFAPDFVWIKDRTAAGSGHGLFDSIRGATKGLVSSSTGAEITDAVSLTSFNSDGYSLGTGATTFFVNANGNANVGWLWKAGGAAVTNTSGSISSQVSANPTAGFSVVTYTGTGALATVGHGLGVAPRFIIVKSRGSVTNWAVWHSSLSGMPNNELVLNSTAAAPGSSTAWGNSPSSSVFSVWTDGKTNGGSATYVAYCFSEVAGYSRFGSYTGNGSTDGPFVFCGFRPRWVLMKRTDVVSDWWVFDTQRAPFNQMDKTLYPNLSNAEFTGTLLEDFLSNGFKIRSTAAPWNVNGGTYIFAAFAENPFKHSLAR